MQLVLRDGESGCLLRGSGLAGEMLDIVHTGMSVILAVHSNTERDFLHRAKGKNKWLCEEGVFKLDRDPLKII